MVIKPKMSPEWWINIEVFTMNFNNLVKQLIVIFDVIAWIRLQLKVPELINSNVFYSINTTPNLKKLKMGYKFFIIFIRICYKYYWSIQESYKITTLAYYDRSSISSLLNENNCLSDVVAIRLLPYLRFCCTVWNL